MLAFKSASAPLRCGCGVARSVGGADHRCGGLRGFSDLGLPEPYTVEEPKNIGEPVLPKYGFLDIANVCCGVVLYEPYRFTCCLPLPLIMTKM